MRLKSCLMAVILCTGLHSSSEGMALGPSSFLSPSRYYDAEQGRFISPETHVGDSTDPQQLNRYAYVKNNPLNYIDPTGHFVTALVAGAVFSGVIAGAQTDWNPEAMGRAAFIGAVSGSVFSGVSGLGMFSNNALAGSIVGGAASGATAGGLHAGMYGGNIGSAMLSYDQKLWVRI